MSSSASASNDAVASTTAPWADLLPELCGLVVDLLDPISALRFPAACKGWAAACKDNPLLQSGAPTLLTSGAIDPEDGLETDRDFDAGTFGLHDVSAAGGGRSFHGEAEGLKGRTWIGGKDDWLATTDYNLNVELLNPVTGDRVPLPPFDATQQQGVELQVPGYLHVSAEGGSWHRILKVTLCQTPAHPGGYLAVALFSNGLMASTAAGDKCWTVLKNPVAASWLDLSYIDAIVLEGKLFAVSESGRVYCWDMASKTTEPEVMQGPEIIDDAAGDYGGFYLATSTRRQLVLVYVYGDTELFRDSRVHSRLVFNHGWSFDELGMSLHELDGCGAWRRVTDLGGDGALFLGANHPFYITVPPGSKSTLKANCVYVADTPSGYDTGVFDLKNGQDGFVDRRAYSFMAETLHTPMWFRPTTHPRLLNDTIKCRGTVAYLRYKM